MVPAPVYTGRKTSCVGIAPAAIMFVDPVLTVMGPGDGIGGSCAVIGGGGRRGSGANGEATIGCCNCMVCAPKVCMGDIPNVALVGGGTLGNVGVKFCVGIALF